MTNPAWRGDIDIDAALALRLVSGQFPLLRAEQIESVGIGWDNAAFLINGAFVFRFPRRRVVAPLIEREAAILPLVAPQVPLAIPVPSFVGLPTPEYPWLFAGYELIEGTTACSVGLSDQERCALAEPLALFLRTLHDIDTAPLIARGLPPDEIGRLDHAKRLPLTHARSPILAEAGVGDSLGAFYSWLETHPPLPIDDAKRTLVHGDLYARHVLLNAHGQATGVIDWGDIHLGDPAIDIAIAHLMLPSFAHAFFRAAYGPIDDRTWMAARYRAIYHAILEIDYGIRENDSGMRDIGLAALRLMSTDSNED